MQAHLEGKKKWIAIILALIVGPVVSVKYLAAPDPLGSKAVIYVDTLGVPPGIADEKVGSSVLPCATPGQAHRMAERLAADETHIIVRPGEYVGSFDWANLNNVFMHAEVGGGAVTLTGAEGAAAVITVNPDDVGKSFVFGMDGFEVAHVTDQDGIVVTNEHLSYKMLGTIKVSTDQQDDASDSIVVVNASAPDARSAIHIELTSYGEIEGGVRVVVGDTNDRFYAKDVQFCAPIYVTGVDRTANLRFDNCRFVSDFVARSDWVHEDIWNPTGNSQEKAGGHQVSVIGSYILNPISHRDGHDEFRRVTQADFRGTWGRVHILD